VVMLIPSAHTDSSFDFTYLLSAQSQPKRPIVWGVPQVPAEWSWNVMQWNYSIDLRST
jgi:hypothetical protein